MATNVKTAVRRKAPRFTSERDKWAAEANQKAVSARETQSVYVWELPIRIFHWVNAAAIMVLMFTGIYIGHPFITPATNGEAYYDYVMGWMRIVHFFTAFVFTANLIFRLYWTFKGNHYAKSQILQGKFWFGLVETLKGYLFLPNHKPHYIGHNPLAQLSYWIFIGLGSVIMVFTGYYLLFSPQPDTIFGKAFFWVPMLFGGSDFTVRSWHHLVAWAFMIFIVIHVYMSFREDWMSKNGTMSSIFTGYKLEPLEKNGSPRAGRSASFGTDRKASMKTSRVDEATAQPPDETIRTAEKAEKITILGIGNTLYADEGVGIHLLPKLQETLSDVENIEYIDGSTEGMQLLGPVEGTDALIVIDAIDAGKAPGEVITVEKDQIPSFNGIKMSVHQIGFQEVVSAAGLRDRLPERMVLIGIQPDSLELGSELSETVRQKLPELIARVKKQIAEWREPS